MRRNKSLGSIRFRPMPPKNIEEIDLWSLTSLQQRRVKTSRRLV
jgi:hypothetical protein